MKQIRSNLSYNFTLNSDICSIISEYLSLTGPTLCKDWSYSLTAHKLPLSQNINVRSSLSPLCYLLSWLTGIGVCFQRKNLLSGVLHGAVLRVFNLFGRDMAAKPVRHTQHSTLHFHQYLCWLRNESRLSIINIKNFVENIDANGTDAGLDI